MTTITLYRAMCGKEASRTLLHKRPDFSAGRYKHFSPGRRFVRDRVQDGTFNNSRFKPERYTHLLRFKIWAEDAVWFNKGEREWKLYVRRAHNVRWLSVELIGVCTPIY